jgi:hypothetical protein
MAKRERLTDAGLAKLPRRAERYIHKDPEHSGHYIRVPSEGHRPLVFVAVARAPTGRQVWATLGDTGSMKIGEAREKAFEAIGRIKKGLTAVKAEPETFEAVARRWLKEHVEKKKLRSAAEITSPTTGWAAASPQSGAEMWRSSSTGSRTGTARARPNTFAPSCEA